MPKVNVSFEGNWRNIVVLFGHVGVAFEIDRVVPNEFKVWWEYFVEEGDPTHGESEPAYCEYLFVHVWHIVCFSE